VAVRNRLSSVPISSTADFITLSDYFWISCTPNDLTYLVSSYRSVQQADIALCVVSTEELERRHSVAREPPVAGVWGTEMEPLLTPETLILLNKIDLAKQSSARHAHIMQEVSSEVLGRRHEDVTTWWWPVSLATDEGMQGFVQGLVGTIKQRYERRHNLPIHRRG
jgi:translation elongation factor EF-1alpha